MLNNKKAETAKRQADLDKIRRNAHLISVLYTILAKAEFSKKDLTFSDIANVMQHFCNAPELLEVFNEIEKLDTLSAVFALEFEED